jgi:hypothetical protein
MDLLLSEYKNLSNIQQISEGYGEYLVYNNQEVITKETYSRIFKVFDKYLYNPEIEFESISKIISKKVKKIDENIETVFIPRTLYDLLFVAASLKEEEKHICMMQMKPPSQNHPICYHTIDPSDEKPVSNNDPELVDLSYRFNQFCINAIQLQEPVLSGEKIKLLTEKYIGVLQKHREKYQWNPPKGPCDSCGIAINFGSDLSLRAGRTVAYAMAIQDYSDVEILQRAVALECSQIAKNAFILYRAGNKKNDDNLTIKHHQSFSYGSSLLAGCSRDGTATVLHYILDQRREGYAMVIPFKDWIDAPFVGPSYSPFALVQLLAQGEFFHPRSMISCQKTPKEVLDVGISVQGVSGKVPKSKLKDLATELPPGELSTYINGHHINSFALTP